MIGRDKQRRISSQEAEAWYKIQITRKRKNSSTGTHAEREAEQKG